MTSEKSVTSAEELTKLPHGNDNLRIDVVPKKQANTVDAQVGNRIRLRRMLVGMSQEKLGDLLGLTFQQIQKYEKGINRIGAGRLFQVAHILGVPIAFFYEGIAEPMRTAPGVTEDDVMPPVLEFLGSGEGLQLSLAYTRIKNPKVRKRVLDLIKSLSETDGTEEVVA